MFAVFADYACTANIYTHQFNIACIHAAERLLFREHIIREKVSNGQFANVYTLEIYPLYGNCVQTVLLTIIHGLKLRKSTYARAWRLCMVSLNCCSPDLELHHMYVAIVHVHQHVHSSFVAYT